MEHSDALEEEETKIKAMNRKVQKTKEISKSEQVADTNLLKKKV